jgi:uncharacterized protein
LVISLSRRLKQPGTWLAALGVLLVLCVVDAWRSPSNQWLGAAYVGLVHGYQRFGRPLTSGFVRCRYSPTCSEYSAAAVERFGIGRGLWLTVLRLRSCTAEVPEGTFDPVPQS